MQGASLLRWPRTFPRNAVMCWSSCARSTRMTRSHGSKGCHPNSACTFIRSRATDERSGDVVQEAVRGTEGGAQLRPWRGHPLYAEVLGQTHAVPTASWGTTGQQHRRANAEDGYSSSEERYVLPK